MDAAEFRIGNIVIDAKGRPCKVDSISATEGTNAYAIQGAMTTHPISPIPLTNEWVDKCVQLKRSETYQTVLSAKLDSVYMTRPFREATHLLVKAIPGTKVTSVKYLHQLQNLYYVITGEELEVKL